MGDSCRISQTDSAGVCKIYTDCPQAFHGRRVPDLCSYLQNDAVICCPTATGMRSSSTTSPAPVINELRPNGSPGLANNFGGPRPSQISECNQSIRLRRSSTGSFINLFASPHRVWRVLKVGREQVQCESPGAGARNLRIWDAQLWLYHSADCGWRESENRRIPSHGSGRLADRWSIGYVHVMGFPNTTTIMFLGQRAITTDWWE